MAEAYALEVWFSKDLDSWEKASEQLPLGVTEGDDFFNPEGEHVQPYLFSPSLRSLFWKLEVIEP